MSSKLKSHPDAELLTVLQIIGVSLSQQPQCLCWPAPLMCPPPSGQSVVCGHGTRYRNLSCFVSDGSSGSESSAVDEELCGSLELAVDGDKQILLSEACTLPCPGNQPASTRPLTEVAFIQPPLLHERARKVTAEVFCLRGVWMENVKPRTEWIGKVAKTFFF